jgi:hypothetical protein
LQQPNSPASTDNTVTIEVKHNEGLPAKQLWIDTESTTYSLYPTNAAFPVWHPPTIADLGMELGFVPEGGSSGIPSTPVDEEVASPLLVEKGELVTSPVPFDAPSPSESVARDDMSDLFTPVRSSALIRIVSEEAGISFHKGTTMLWLHLLHVFQSTRSSYSGTVDDLLQDITNSFYSLSVLASIRWQLRSNPILPFHLAAVEIMEEALEADNDRLFE